MADEQFRLVGGERDGQTIKSDGSRFLRIPKQVKTPFSPRPIPVEIKIEFDEYRLREHSTLGWVYVLTSMADEEATRWLTTRS